MEKKKVRHVLWLLGSTYFITYHPVIIVIHAHGRYIMKNKQMGSSKVKGR